MGGGQGAAAPLPSPHKPQSYILMPVIDQKDVLKGLTVAEAMRHQVIAVATGTPLEKVIRFTIKYKGERHPGHRCATSMPRGW